MTTAAMTETETTTTTTIIWINISQGRKAERQLQDGIEGDRAGRSPAKRGDGWLEGLGVKLAWAVGRW